MINDIVSIINNSYVLTTETFVTLALVLGYNIYSIISNKMYFNDEGLSDEDAAFLYVLYNYFHYNFNVNNNSKLGFDMKDLFIYVDNQLS